MKPCIDQFNSVNQKSNNVYAGIDVFFSKIIFQKSHYRDIEVVKCYNFGTGDKSFLE
jgi:hypothetical protein